MTHENDQLRIYREICRQVKDAIAIIGPDGIYLEQNPAHHTLLGYDDADLKGQTPAIHLGGDTFEKIHAATVENSCYSGEVTGRTKNGTLLDLDMTGYPVKNRSGRIVCCVNVFKNLPSLTPGKQLEDALRMSREKYQTVLESSPDPVVVYDMQGRVMYINLAFTRVFGWAPGELIGRKIDFVPDANWPETREMIANVSTGKSFSGYETRRYTKSGRIVDVSISAAIFAEADGKPLGSVITLADITGKKQLEAKLFQAHKMEAVGTLAGGIAHDFNNILQAISGYTQILMLDKPADSDEHRMLQAIEKSVERAGELTKQLLIFGRKVESELRPVDLNHEVVQVSRILKRTIPKMIDVQLELVENLPAIDADPVQLEQIMMNLGVNARDAMGDSGTLLFETALIHLDREADAAHPLSAPGEYVMLRMTDTGHGMDKSTRERIFEPFFTTKEVGKGTGLGLAMVYGIVQNHGGEIVCRSAPGQGASFEIYFPVPKSKKTREADERTDEELSRGRETILLVDDEKNLIDIGTSILERFGYRVIPAFSGEQALERLTAEKDRFDLVILDISMPGMGGYRCLEEILGHDPGAKVLIASGYAASGYEQEAIASGAAGFIGKPYKISEMLSKVRAVLDR